MTFGFIGCGNMGSALAESAAKAVSPENIFLSNRTPEKAILLAQKLGARFSDNEKIAANCDFIYLAIKPQKYPEVCPLLFEVIKKNKRKPVIISMAAGISIDTVISYFPGCPVIRIMPNTPVAIGKGVILYDDVAISDEDEKTFLSLSKAAGAVIKLDEKDIDAASVVSGCGPAFVYLFLDAVAKAAEKTGLEKETALRLFANTLIGASHLFLESGKTPDELCRAVCSPGGSTIEGVNVFRNDGLDSLSEKAIKASFTRTKELGKK